jgi:hypothetical protein
MRRTVLQEGSAVVAVLALAVAAALGRPGVMLGLGVLLLAVAVVAFWWSRAQGWLLTTGIGGLAAVAVGVAWLAA